MEKINYKILDNGCWECICKSYSKGGYPTVVFNKKTCNTHRYVFIMEKNNGVDLPKDIVIRHTCDNRKCVNPNHLISGTQNDNIQDCVNRKRTNRFKVKDCDVKEIKFLYFLGIKTESELSFMFKLPEITILNIVNFKIYKNIQY